MTATSATGRYRFALRPKWVLSHVLVGALVIAMIAAGFWQLGRLDDRRESNQLVADRALIETMPLERVLAESDAAADLEFRRVTVSGTFLPESEYLIANRTLESTPGFWVFTPLVTGPDSAVIVNRGFIARATVQQDLADFSAPTGEVTVTGLLFESVDGGRFAEGGEFTELSRPDVTQMQTIVDEQLAPLYVQLESPAQDFPVALDPPDRGEGPHFSYAMQWFIFTTIALVGYPLVLRRVAGGGRKRVGVAPPLDEPH